MRRLIAAMIAGIAAVALIVTPATAQGPEYPESEGWVYLKDPFVIPAGYACDEAVEVRFVGHIRQTVDGVPLTEQPQPGDVVVIESPDMVMRVTNIRSGDTVRREVTGTWYDTVRASGRDIRRKGVGQNPYFGPGVIGILWSSGRQYYTIYDFASPDASLELTETSGRTIELCNRVEARPVPGKAPEPSANARSNRAVGNLVRER